MMVKKINKNFLSRAMVLGAIMLLTSVGMVQAGSASALDAKEQNAVSSPQQAKITVKGVVSDNMGTIIGANILEKGTTNGTVTDMDGAYTLSVSSNAILVVSYIGYLEQQIPVNGKTTINVSLVEDSQALDEVVVVGYGTQKKVNLSGSVSSINVGELMESRPITNVSHALAGMAAGVQVSSASNQPGNDDASITVRGQGTLNDASPLVIIDGVESSINSVNPQDIESMSILKDAASAAIYGSRAANGVILITTKQGKSGTLKLDYNGYVSFESIRKTLTPVSNYADYMELINEGYANSNLATVFSQSPIDAWRNDAGRNPLQYPNTDWIDETFRSATAQNHVVSMSGGSEKIRFYTSFGYSNNPGVMENTGYERYNGRFNIEADVKPWLKLGAQVNGYVANMDPAAKHNKNDETGTVVDDIFTFASATTPGMVFRAPDGRYGAMNNSEDAAQSANNNPLKRLNSAEGTFRNTNMRARFSGTLTPFKGFSVTASYSYEFTDNQRETKSKFIDGWNFQTETITSTGSGQSSVYNYNRKVERFFGDIVARYDTRLLDKRLGLNAMFGGSQELFKDKNFDARKYDMIDLSLSVINGAVGDASATGTSTEWAMHSFFGRINLDWENKYLLEVNLRGDASSRFLKDERWGYFPSISGAWRLDQEAFMESLVDQGLSNLKVRASYGSLGNNSVGNYDALAMYANARSKGENQSLNYVLNNSLAMGMAQVMIANSKLTWESTYYTNVGVDFGLINNHLTGTIEFFNKKTKNILINLPAPDVHGIADIPKQNSAQVTNKGVEISLGWQDKVNDFSYSINGNFTYVKNNVDKFKGKGEDGMSLTDQNLIWEGHPINSQYMLKVDRIIQTDDDLRVVQDMIDKNPSAFAAFGTPEKGDLLYQDTNGDGIIDNKDRVIVSDGPNPKYYFGLNLAASYKGFDFSALLQGVAGVKEYWQSAAYNTPTVRVGYQLNKEITDGRWYEGRTDAKYPRLLQYQDTRNTQASDLYLENKAYLKIKNIQLGYTLPKAWTNAMQIERVRVYGSLENFFTFTKYKGFDPEVSGMRYPSMKEAVIGLNVTF
jgi:TonB-linked SusC/RagA family outer membrane protein